MIEDFKIGVVEDDASMLKALAFQLRSAGAIVASYASAKDFLSDPDVTRLDCVVVDLHLPRMNGLQLQQTLNRSIPFASIVFITGGGDTSIGVRAMKEGAVNFLEKPLDPKALLDSLSKVRNDHENSVPNTRNTQSFRGATTH